MHREHDLRTHAAPRTLHFVAIDAHGNRTYLNLATIATAEWLDVGRAVKLTWPGGEEQVFGGVVADAIRAGLDAMFIPPARPLRPARPSSGVGPSALRACPNRHCRSESGPYDGGSADGTTVWVECFNCLMGGPGVYVQGKTLEEAHAEARRLWNDLPRDTVDPE